MDDEIRNKEAIVASLRDEAARIVASASAEGRELTKAEDAHVLALVTQVRSLEEEIHRLAKHRSAH